MRIVTHLELESLQQRLQSCQPGLEMVHLAADQPVDDDLRADSLLTSVLGGDNLASLLRPKHGIRWVHVYGTGVDQFPLELARHVTLTCSRGATAAPIAEWVMAVILAAAKQLPQNWIEQVPQHWYFAPTSMLKGQCLGLLGYGSIARKLAAMAQAFDMQVKALVRQPRDNNTEQGVVFVDSLAELLQSSDHLVVAAPATPSTRHILNAESLCHARPGLHIVNIARGSLIDQQALKQALDGDRVALASLDVVEPEPLPAGHWMYQHPKIRLSPHISWNSPDAIANMESTFVDNVARFVAGRPLIGVVDPDEGY